MDVQKTLQKLKPIIGKKADQFWLSYLSEDRMGRIELESVLNLWANQLLGNDLENKQVLLSSPSKEVAFGEYLIGHVRYAGKTLFPFGIREDEWVQHTAIFGRSGAGKTNAVFKIIDNFLNKKKPFLIFDWKRNYRDILAFNNHDILVYTVGRETVPFQFNPLIPPDGINPKVWMKKLIEIIAHSYYVGEGVMFLFQEAIHAVYDEFKVYSGSPEKYPTFNDIHRWLDDAPVKGRKAQWMDSAARTIKSICFGFMGDVVNTNRQPNIAKMLDENVILELDSLTNADKTLIIESLLLWIHHYRLTQPDREVFKHVIIIEEAHHILLKRTGGKGEALTDTIIREIRELGEAIVLVDQHPSMISTPALGNTYTTITLNLKHRSDVTAISAAMLLDDEEKEIIGRLPIGHAVVKLQGRWVEPFQIIIPHVKVPKGAITDDKLKQLMKSKLITKDPEFLEIVQSIEQSKPKYNPEDKDIIFIKDIIEFPFSGVVERYKRLLTSRRKGNIVKERLLESGIIEQVAIPIRSGKLVLLEFTPTGKELVKQYGLNQPLSRRWGSLEHEYWKHKVVEHYEKLGYIVKLEEPGNGFTDIVIEKEGKKTAIEIETGKSDWKKNIEKNVGKGFEEIIFYVTNDNYLKEIEGYVETQQSKDRIEVFYVQNVM